MPVPSSYNDITQQRYLRDFVGWVWYDKQFFVSKYWKDPDAIRVVLRVEACSYYCIVVCFFILSVINRTKVNPQFNDVQFKDVRFNKDVQFYQGCSVLSRMFSFTKDVQLKDVQFYQGCSLLSRMFSFIKDV